MRSLRLVALTTAIAVSGVGFAAPGSAADRSEAGHRTFHAHLTGYEEDPLVLSTAGRGTFRAVVDDHAQEISYRLSYTGLSGVTQAHIHFGGRAQSGGVSAFLCASPGSGPAGTPACPTAGGTVTGTIEPADVVGPAAQGIAPGDFKALVAAIRAGKTYANVHTTAHPAGEIRGQLN